MAKRKHVKRKMHCASNKTLWHGEFAGKEWECCGRKFGKRKVVACHTYDPAKRAAAKAAAEKRKYRFKSDDAERIRAGMYSNAVEGLGGYRRRSRRRRHARR